MASPSIPPHPRDMKACRRLLGVPLVRARTVCEHLYEDQPVSACLVSGVPVPPDEDLRETYFKALEEVEARERTEALREAHETVLLRRRTLLTLELHSGEAATCLFKQTLGDFVDQVEDEANGVVLVKRWRKQTLGSRLAASLLDVCHRRFDFAEDPCIWYASRCAIKCLTIEPARG